jgi:hypothetical protein
MIGQGKEENAASETDKKTIKLYNMTMRNKHGWKKEKDRLEKEQIK